MSQLVIDLIEAAVGLVCMVAAAAAWRRPGLRVAALALAGAGALAVGHAILSIAEG